MALARIQSKFYTAEEYLAIEITAVDKSEYFKGEIFAMAGGSANHNRIAGNAYAVLNNGLRSSSCEAFSSDMRLLVKAKELYTYPDTMVVCGRVDFAKGRTDTLTNPIAIVEVLSPSTRDYDRGQKFEFYRTIPTLQDYVLIHQEQVHIEYHYKPQNGLWTLAEFINLEETFTLRSLKFELSIRRLYERVDWLPV